MDEDCRRIIGSEMVLGPIYGPRTMEQEIRWMEIVKVLKAPVTPTRFKHLTRFARRPEGGTDAD